MSLPALKPEPLPILLIEDEPAVMAYVCATLERSGYQVVCAKSGAEGLQQLETGEFTHRPDLTSNLVFITGDIATEKTVDTLRKTGAPCVEKPFRVQQFISVVEKTMGKAL